jgi:anti-sigma factor RsiW
MSDSPCDDFDDYLDETISDSNRHRFEAHLLTCPDCHRELQLQRQVNSLLAAAAHLEPVSVALVDRVERRIFNATILRRWYWATGIAAAVMIVVTIGAWFGWRPAHRTEPVVTSSPPDEKQSKDFNVVQDNETIPASAVDVKVGPTLAGIVVPMKSDNAKVAIFWIYPSIPPSPNPLPD